MSRSWHYLTSVFWGGFVYVAYEKNIVRFFCFETASYQNSFEEWKFCKTKFFPRKSDPLIKK